MRAVTHLEKVITGEVSAVTHLEKVIAGEVSAVTYTEKVITGEATPITHLQKVIAGIASPVTHLEQVWAGGSPTPSEHEYTGAVPVTITADGTPLLDFLISGNEEHAGTPSSDNPIMPQGTGELETNLAIISGDSKTIENRYYTDVRISDVLEAGTYTISYVIDEKTGNASLSSVGFGTRYVYQKDFESFTVRNVPTTITVTVTLDSEGCLWARFLRAGSATDFSYSVSHVRVEKGTQSYGYKIPISSANTTTPVYLGEVETVRRIQKYIFTGTEDWRARTLPDNSYSINYSAVNTGSGVTYRGVCSHFANPQSSVSNITSGQCYFGTSAVSFRLDDTTDLTQWTNWLKQQYQNGTPVAIWYVLTAEETGIVNEPLMKIGDYADTLSMEQAGVSIPTLNGQTVIDVDTALKPSEMYIKYKG